MLLGSAVCLAAAALAAAAPAPKALRLANVFNNHMVLQQQAPVRIWGRAAPGAEVILTLTEDRRAAEPYLKETSRPAKAASPAPRLAVEVVERPRPAFHPQTVRVRADAQGRWEAAFRPMPASFAAKWLIVRSGEETTVLEDILIGEVWLCAGQSNMVWANYDTKDIESLAPDLPGLRYLKADQTWHKPREDLERPANWILCTREARNRMSAIPYLFGRDLLRVLGAPVGMINVARGGTTGQAWCSREELDRIDFAPLRKALAEYDAETRRWEDPAYRERVIKEWEAACEKARAEHEAKVREAKAAGKPAPRLRLPKRPGDPRSGWSPPAGKFNANVWPLRKLAIRGVLFHQGENNYFSGWTQYEYTFPAVIRSFRAAFGDDALPFGIITLPGWGMHGLPTEVECVGDGYQAIRDIHIRVHERMKHTGLICPTLSGDGYIHPSDKEPVALLALRWALAAVYGKPVLHKGPKPRKIVKAGNKMRVYYELDPLLDKGFEGNKKVPYWAGCAVPRQNGEGPVYGFAVADRSHRWYPAQARVKKGENCVEVWSDLVEDPVAVRYNFANYPMGNLVGRGEIPAIPFRSDTWPLPRKVSSEPDTRERLAALKRAAEAQALDRQVRQAMIDARRAEFKLHMDRRLRGEGRSAATLLESKVDRIEQILDEFQGEDGRLLDRLKRKNPDLVPQILKALDSLKAQAEALRAAARKIKE